MQHRLGIAAVLLFAALMLSAGLAGCKGSNSTPPVHQILTLNVGGNPSNLNPVLSIDSPSGMVSGFIFSSMVRIDPDMNIQPDLASTWNISADGRVYTFTLRSDVVWQDGTPFTAEDVKYTIDVTMSPKTNTVRRSMFEVANTPVKTKVLDPHRIQFTLARPFAPFLLNVGCSSILPKHLLAGQDINKAEFNRKPLGTGPFIFSEWKDQQYVRLIRNPKYFGTRPLLEEIILKIIPDQNTAILACDRGEIDGANLLPKDFPKYAGNNRFTTYKFYDLSYSYLALNLKRAPFSDLRIRQAIAYALNKNAMVTGVLREFGQPVDIPCSPAIWTWPKPVELYPYSPDKSRQLLKEAGYTYNPATRFFEKNGKPLEFTIITNQGNKIREACVQVIQQFLNQVGIKTNIQLMEWSSFIKIVSEPISPKKYDAVILGWDLGMDPDMYDIWHSSQYPKEFNFVGYNNPKVDDLLIKGRETTDRNQRKIIYADLYNIIGKDLPYIFLYNPMTMGMFAKKVHGLSKPGPAGLLNPIEKISIQP